MTAEEIVQRCDALKNARSTWEGHWQECADYVMPRKNSITTTQTKGSKRNLSLFTSRGIRANEKLAAGLFSYLCPNGEKWFEIRPQNDAMSQIDSVKRWFSEVSRIVLQSIANSNFTLQIHENFLDLGTFGTGCIYEEAGNDTPLNFINHHISTYMISENNKGIIDTVYRKFKFTARQAVQEWGEKKLSEKILEAYKDIKRQEEEFEFIHAVFPRKERDKTKKDKENKAIASYYVEVDAKKIVSEGGFDEMPYMVPRFMKSSNEAYGRSPSMSCLPEIKTLNAMKKTILKSGEKAVDPPILAPDDGSYTYNFRIGAGGISYYNPRSQHKPEVFYSGGNINIGLELMQEETRDIEEGFYNDLFKMFDEKKNMTATEILERSKQKLVAFAPTIIRIQGELFRPLIIRAFGILSRLGAIPPPPQELMIDPTYEIEYVSKLALAVKMLETQGIIQALELTTPLSQIQPDILDNYNFDKIAQKVGHNSGMPNDVLRSEDEVAKMREARAQQQAQMQQVEMLERAADAVPKLQKKTEEGSPLDQLAGAL